MEVEVGDFVGFHYDSTQPDARVQVIDNPQTPDGKHFDIVTCVCNSKMHICKTVVAVAFEIVICQVTNLLPMTIIN